MFEPTAFANPLNPERSRDHGRPGSAEPEPRARRQLSGPPPTERGSHDPERWARLQPPRATGATGRGVIALILIVTFIGGLLDMAASGHRGHLFGVFFVIASGLGALVVRRRDLSTAMVAPPLVYCVMIVVMSFIDRGDLTGGFATREVFYLGNAFVTGAPSIWIGTAVAIGIGLVRKRAARGPAARR